MVLFGQNCHYVAFTDGWGGGELVVLRHSPYWGADKSLARPTS